VRPIRKRFVHRFAEPDLEALRARDLDVILRAGFNILRGDVLRAARYGIWSLHHGDNREYRGGPAMFWEIHEGNPLTGSVLQVLTPQLDGGKVIYRSLGATIPVSLHRNRVDKFWKAAEFVPRRLRDLHERGFDWIRSLPTFDEPSDYARGIYRTPRTGTMLRFLVALAGRIAWRKLVNRLFVEHWFLALRERPPGRDRALGDRSGFTPVRTRVDRFYADPFAAEHEGERWVFFEEFVWSTGRGRICCARVGDDLSLGEPRVVLEPDWHVSYPCVFRWRGDWWMVPESEAARRIELYRAVEFPGRWERERVLMQGVRAVDPTLWEHAGRWWMFANLVGRGTGFHDELFLFYADSPLGEWTPHPLNPIVSDVRRARCAGSLFEHEGALYRPAQDCSRTYGGAIVLHRVEHLGPDDYRESPVARIEPALGRGCFGTHTWNRGGSLEVTDGKRLRLRWPG
jgi:hypothetical protein